jgi:hypothetical protein
MVLPVVKKENTFAYTHALVPEAIDGKDSVTIRGRHITFGRWQLAPLIVDDRAQQ